MAAYIRNTTNASVAGKDYSVLGTSFNKAVKDIAEANFKILFIATGTPSIVTDLEFCKLVKERSPSTKIVILGTHVSHYAKDIISKHNYIDFIIHGEPEEPALNIVKYIFEDSEFDHRAITSSNNSSSDILLIEDLDKLPIPAWDLFDLSHYKLPIQGKSFLLVSPQRGCPWKCTFCTAPLYYGSKIRSKSPQKIREEIEYLKKHYGISNFLFWSDTFTANKVYVKELCKEIEDLNIKWVSNSRVDTITEELASVMKDAGCWMLTYGIESLNNDVLQTVQKGFNSSQVEAGVNAAKKSNILTIGHFIMGLPSDNKASLLETFKKAQKLNLDFLQFYYAAPFPGTALHKDFVSRRIVSDHSLNTYSQESENHFRGYKLLARFIKFRTLFRLKTFSFILFNIKARFFA
jgi:radical SAM superfamily enzyme YgiQ (UPF0313 family)